MSQDAQHRRKSRIGPGLLLKRSVGPGGSSTASIDVTNILFSSIRNDQDAHPLRRSQHQYPQDQSPDQQPQPHVSLSQSQSISDVLEDSIDQLCIAVDQLVDKMAVVADIHAGLANFNESFGAFLYGLKMNAGNVEWTEAPTNRSFERMEQREAEAIILQQQQEEVERIRRQQILEQEEKERQRIEAERQEAEAERMKATMSSLHSSHNGSNNNSQSLGRQRRPGTSTVVKGRGITASRIPARSSVQTAAASRVGPGGAVRKLVGRVVMKRMAERLPLRYRDEPHRGPIEAIMRSLSDHIEGQTLPELVAVANVARHRCNEYLGVLIHAKEIVRTNQKGVLFSLNPDRYPSR
ncbi:hypothetical protein BGX26_001656 [Mortierella sp. AD094]|nr:hypothetical protein BGX26_001656 [Mortierella sp. AD094]